MILWFPKHLEEIRIMTDVERLFDASERAGAALTAVVLVLAVTLLAVSEWWR